MSVDQQRWVTVGAKIAPVPLPLKRKERPHCAGRDDEGDVSGGRGHRDIEDGRAGDRMV